MTAFAPIDARLPSTTARWRGAEFGRDLAAWILEALGQEVEVEAVKVRPWSGVWRATSTDGAVHYAKQNTALQSFEAALLVAMGEVVPARVMPVTAYAPDRGLLLAPDQGQVLGEAGDLDAWTRILGEYAALQRELAPHAPRLLAAGLTPLPPDGAEPWLRQRLDEGLAGHLGGEEARALAAALPRRLDDVRRWADAVAALGLPLTVNHNDLHGHNVFPFAGALRFFDFGDALITEPLGALLIPLRTLQDHLGCATDDPRLLGAAEAALEVWSDLAPMPALRAALPAALRLACLAKSESWLRCRATMDDAERAEWGAIPAIWLGEMLGEIPTAGLDTPAR